MEYQTLYPTQLPTIVASHLHHQPNYFAILDEENIAVSECVTQDSGLGDVLGLYLHSNANIRYGHDLNMGIGFIPEQTVI